MPNDLLQAHWHEGNGPVIPSGSHDPGNNWSLHLLLTNQQPGPLAIAANAAADAFLLFCRDVTSGFLAVGRSALALVGLTTLTVLTLCLGDERIRQELEVSAFQWLQGRNELRALESGDTLSGLSEAKAVGRATATDLRELPEAQARLALWISKRYRVAPEPVGALVLEAWEAGKRARLDPTLILATIAVESRFNPFAQSQVGAQGLMQVMTRVHDDKFESFGGTRAAFDPVSNLRVGVQVLKEAIGRGGSIEEGLRHYVGAALLDHDSGYIARVLSEQKHLRAVLEGRKVPLNASLSTVPTPRQQRDPVAEDSAPQAPTSPTAARHQGAATGTHVAQLD